VAKNKITSVNDAIEKILCEQLEILSAKSGEGLLLAADANLLQIYAGIYNLLQGTRKLKQPPVNSRYNKTPNSVLAEYAK